jgi:hypothetical protein
MERMRKSTLLGKAARGTGRHAAGGGEATVVDDGNSFSYVSPAANAATCSA